MATPLIFTHRSPDPPPTIPSLPLLLLLLSSCRPVAPGPGHPEGGGGSLQPAGLQGAPARRPLPAGSAAPPAGPDAAAQPGRHDLPAAGPGAAVAGADHLHEALTPARHQGHSCCSPPGGVGAPSCFRLLSCDKQPCQVTETRCSSAAASTRGAGKFISLMDEVDPTGNHKPDQPAPAGGAAWRILMRLLRLQEGGREHTDNEAGS